MAHRGTASGPGGLSPWLTRTPVPGLRLFHHNFNRGCDSVLGVGIYFAFAFFPGTDDSSGGYGCDGWVGGGIADAFVFFHLAAGFFDGGFDG